MAEKTTQTTVFHWHEFTSSCATRLYPIKESAFGGKSRSFFFSGRSELVKGC
jgi:hypothetical protein